jgi:hypothetical protein
MLFYQNAVLSFFLCDVRYMLNDYLLERGYVGESGEMSINHASYTQAKLARKKDRYIAK